MAQARTTHRPRWDAVHAMLGAFPLAFFPAALATDVAYAASAQMQWANFSAWLIAGGVVMGVVSAVAGILDAVASRNRVRRGRTALHGILTLAAFVVAVVNGFVHSRDAWTSVVPTGLVLSAVSAVLILAAGWSGYSAAEPE